MRTDLPNLDEPVADKLKVFISSRLQECKDERTIARDAVYSVNHDPILFEHVGARPIAARKLYLSRLDTSAIMIAIFKKGYGYIDAEGGMEISGLEDEFLFAEEKGIPTLLYVHRDDSDRDEELNKLIKHASQTLTIWHYQDLDQLRERIREDVTATITRMVLRPELSRGALDETAGTLLDRAEKRQGPILERQNLSDALRSAASQNEIVCVFGAAGIGKTTLVARYAREVDAVFVRATNLTPRDAFSVCAQAIAGERNTPTPYATIEGAKLAFSSAWAEAKQVELVLDECSFIEEVLAAIELGGGTSGHKSLVYTSRGRNEGHAAIQVTPLSESEVASLIEASGADLGGLPSGELTALQVQSYIGSIERASLQRNRHIREVVSYLALSPVGLSALQVLDLVGDTSFSVEDLYEGLRSVGRLIDDTPGGLQLIHSETAASFRAELKETPQRLRFYVTRLTALFADSSDFRSAYSVSECLEDGSEAEFAPSAMRQSAQLGDFRFALHVGEKRLQEAKSGERSFEQLRMMLDLVYPLELLGEALRASDLLGEAELLADELGGDAPDLVGEQRLSSRARRTLAEADVESLVALHNEYGQANRDWDQARISIELSVLFIAGKKFEDAIRYLRPAVETFSSIGDEYGLDIAERNLTASLAALPGNEAETDALISKIESRAEGRVDGRRQKAWYGNILTRRYRIAGRLKEAEKIAKEILEISAELGDEALSALNFVNLGNIYRDAKEPEKAIEAYDNAARAAQRSGRQDIEGDSSRFRAGILNDFEVEGISKQDRHQQAIAFADHAIGLLTGTIYYDAIARAYVERADAQSQLGNTAEAAKAWFQAAANFKNDPDEEAYANAILRGSDASIESHVHIYVTGLVDLFEAEIELSGTTLSDVFIDLIGPIIRKAPKDSLIPLLGSHLATVRNNLPPLVRPLLLKEFASVLRRTLSEESGVFDSWRPLRAALFVPFLAQDNELGFVQRQISRAISKGVEGLTVRHSDSNDIVWTVSLALPTPTLISIFPLDESAAAAVAAQSLALFLKSFETDMAQIVDQSALSEVTIQVASFDQAPDDVRSTCIELFHIDETLEKQTVAVTRTDDYSGRTPMVIFLGSDFLARMMAGEGMGGSLQYLLGFSLVELVRMLLAGEVDEEEIRPKLVSMVKETIS